MFRFEHAPIKLALAPVMHSIAGAAFASTESTAAESDEAIEYRKGPFLIRSYSPRFRLAGTSTLMRRIFSGCCARAASGHAAAPLRKLMKSRRLM